MQKADSMMTSHVSAFYYHYLSVTQLVHFIQPKKLEYIFLRFIFCMIDWLA